MFKTEDDVFIRVESDKNRGLQGGMVKPGKMEPELPKILPKKCGREISINDVKSRIKYIHKFF
jgi:hypothetical protein